MTRPSRNTDNEGTTAPGRQHDEASILPPLLLELEICQ